jgi:chemoreceptor-like protein with four helix bundle sensory module
MKQWTIGRRLTVGFCAVITLAVALGAYASYGVLQIQRAAKAVTGDALPGIIGMDQADAMAHENDALAYRHIASESDQQKAEIEKQMAENSKTADAAFRQYETSITTTRDRELFEAIAGPRAENTAIRSGKVLVLSRAHKTREALAAYEPELAPVSRDTRRRFGPRWTSTATPPTPIPKRSRRPCRDRSGSRRLGCCWS